MRQALIAQAVAYILLIRIAGHARDWQWHDIIKPFLSVDPMYLDSLHQTLCDKKDSISAFRGIRMGPQELKETLDAYAQLPFLTAATHDRTRPLLHAECHLDVPESGGLVRRALEQEAEGGQSCRR